MQLEQRLEILEEQYSLMNKYFCVCRSKGSTIDYTNIDFSREQELRDKIKQTKQWIKERVNTK